MQQPGGVTSEVRTYFTGRGAEFQTRVQVDPTTWLVSGRRIVNPWGDLSQEFEPAYSASPEFDLPPVSGVAARTVAYDARGRVVRTVNFTGGVSTAEYQPFAVVTADADDNDHSPSNVARGLADTPHREEFDAFRQRTRVVEVLGGGDALALTYIPDANGRVLSAPDALGPLFECTYDKVGHRLTTLHREAGLRRLYYDARGKVVRSLDANGNDLTVELDERGRVVRLRDGGEPSSSTPTTTWHSTPTASWPTSRTPPVRRPSSTTRAARSVRTSCSPARMLRATPSPSNTILSVGNRGALRRHSHRKSPHSTAG